MRRILVFGLISLCVAAQEQSGQTFKSGVTMIQVPVAVRDRRRPCSRRPGRRTTFQLFDDGKPVEIAGFSADKPGSYAIPDRSLPDPDAKPATDAAPMDLPERFIAYFFDDVSVGGIATLQRVRDAASKQLNEMQPGDRVAIVTSSCSTGQDFTNDRTKLREALSTKSSAGMPGFTRPGIANRSAEECCETDGKPAGEERDLTHLGRVLGGARPFGSTGRSD